MRKPKYDEKIVCPSCGREYLPAEIFIPDAFLGKPQDIEKNSVGKIESFSGNSMDTEETFICDGCKNPFRVIAKVQFVAVTPQRVDFNTDFQTTYKPKND